MQEILLPLNRQVPGVFWGSQASEAEGRSLPCPWGLRVAAGQTGVRVGKWAHLELIDMRGQAVRHGWGTSTQGLSINNKSIQSIDKFN